MELQQLLVQIPKDLRKKIKALAALQEKSLREIVEEALKDLLKKYETPAS